MDPRKKLSDYEAFTKLKLTTFNLEFSVIFQAFSGLLVMYDVTKYDFLFQSLEVPRLSISTRAVPKLPPLAL